MARFDRTIPPGQEGKITIEVKTKGLQGPIHKAAQVVTNDPAQSQFALGMRGTVWVAISVLPKHVRLDGVVGSVIETAVVLRGEKEEPLELRIDSVSDPDQVAVELKELEKGRAYELRVKNKQEGAGRYGGQVHLATNYPDKPTLVVPIVAAIKSPVETRPEAIGFGNLSQAQLGKLAEAGRFMRRPVIVMLNTGTDLKIAEVKVAEGPFKVAQMREMRPGQIVEIQVEALLERLQKGANKGVVEIHTNQKAMPLLKVPVLLTVL